MALWLLLLLSCGGGAFMTYEDVFLSIRSISIDMGVETGMSNHRQRLLTHRGCHKALCFRHVSGLLPFVATLRAYSRLASLVGWSVIKSGFEADDVRRAQSHPAWRQGGS